MAGPGDVEPQASAAPPTEPPAKARKAEKKAARQAKAAARAAGSAARKAERRAVAAARKAEKRATAADKPTKAGVTAAAKSGMGDGPTEPDIKALAGGGTSAASKVTTAGKAGGTPVAKAARAPQPTTGGRR